MTPNELMHRYWLARIIGWRHELELLDAEAVAQLIKVLKSANATLRARLEAELPQVWASYTADKGGAAVRLWLGELLADPAMQVETTIADAWVLSAQTSLAIYNDILSFGGLAKNIAAVPISMASIAGLASKKLFAGRTLGELVVQSFTQGQVATVIETLDNGIKQGWSYPKVIKDLNEKALDAGLQITQRESITLARSYIQQASVNAQVSVYEANKKIVRGVEWCAILDNRVCPLCFTGSTEVAPIGRLRGVTKRPYVGDIITVTTSSGKQVSSTPKHPILTPEGWCAFEKLNPGDQVIYSEKSDVLNILGKQEIDMPTKFSELFDFFSSQSFSEVKRYCTSADAFNGDSGIFNSYITTICKNSLLESNVGYPALAQFIPYKDFTFHNSGLIFLSGNSAFDVIFNRMSANSPWLPSFFNASLIKCFMDQGYSEALPMQFFWRESLQVQFNYFRFFILAILASISFRNIWHSFVFDKKIGNGGSANGKMSCDFTGRNSLPVHCENIVSIRREWRSCHVYNLHCDEELYTANGFIVKNCAATDGLKYTMEEEKPPMPRHPRCFLPQSRLYAPDAFVMFKAHYDGPAYRIVLANGAVLFVTARHPILTNKGFIPAYQIDQDTLIWCNDQHRGRGNTAERIYQIAYDKIGHAEMVDIMQASLHGDGYYAGDSVELLQGDMPHIGFSDIDERFELYERLGCGQRNRSVYELFVDPHEMTNYWKKKSWLSLQPYRIKEKFHYQGPVYDFQTLSTLYYADTAIISNCRCLWLPWVKSWRDLGIEQDELERAARPWLIREEGNIDAGGRKILYSGTSKEDFAGWWKTLPYDQQIKSIGPVRTDLIRAGKLTWKDLMDKNTGRFYTLKELGFAEDGKKLL